MQSIRMSVKCNFIGVANKDYMLNSKNHLFKTEFDDRASIELAPTIKIERQCEQNKANQAAAMWTMLKPIVKIENANYNDEVILGRSNCSFRFAGTASD